MNDYQVVVIGSGPGGYVAAIKAAQLGLKTVCIEKSNTLGGTCLNVGCIPSKCLLHSSELLFNAENHFLDHGIQIRDIKVDFSKVMQRKNRVVQGFTKGVEFLLKKNKVAVIHGHAKLVDPHTVQIGNKSVRSDYIILATGSEPIELDFLPFDEKRVVSSTGVLELKNIPKRLLIVGAGIIGVELGSVYQRLGSQVQFVEFLDRICPSFDMDLSKEALKLFTSQGMEFYLSHKVTKANISDKEIILLAQGPKEIKTFVADVVLVCIGRKPYLKNLGLEEMKIATDERGFVKVNDSFQSSIPNIYAIGDLIGGPMLAHKASEEGFAVSEIIASKKTKVQYAAIPSVAYTLPEIASVGFNENTLKEKTIPFKCFSFPLKANSRARCIGEMEGFVKVIVHESTHQILGVHIIGARASELISEAVIAMHNKLKVEGLLNASHAHPTLSEALKEAALGVFEKPIHL